MVLFCPETPLDIIPEDPGWPIAPAGKSSRTELAARKIEHAAR
jgi:hypothetical protein